ncbi:hypothetical protein HPB47_013937 [Ixodes persulcatus]|uniref:Uncharacterized protein n=1 Tax=Ixodes persulcatus TaxID=34615 RepID=A0AC60QXG1_IXOPE|nr:hypothetical protein HPB47_013937 [Ixodes persulcatus]
MRTGEALFDSACSTKPESDRVARVIQQSQPRFRPYLHGRTYETLEHVARDARGIQETLLAELQYQPPPPPEEALEPRGLTQRQPQEYGAVLPPPPARSAPTPSGSGSAGEHHPVAWSPGLVPGRLDPDHGRVKAIACPTRKATDRNDKPQAARHTALTAAFRCAALAVADKPPRGLGKPARPTVLTPKRPPAALTMDNSAALPSVC